MTENDVEKFAYHSGNHDELGTEVAAGRVEAEHAHKEQDTVDAVHRLGAPICTVLCIKT